jgi:hypothetical protein
MKQVSTYTPNDLTFRRMEAWKEDLLNIEASGMYEREKQKEDL